MAGGFPWTLLPGFRTGPPAQNVARDREESMTIACILGGARLAIVPALMAQRAARGDAAEGKNSLVKFWGQGALLTVARTIGAVRWAAVRSWGATAILALVLGVTTPAVA